MKYVKYIISPHKKRSFPFRISRVNSTKSAVNFVFCAVCILCIKQRNSWKSIKQCNEFNIVVKQNRPYSYEFWKFLTLKRLGWVIWHPLWFFRKFLSYRKGEALFLWLLLLYKSHLLWKIHWNSSSQSEDMKIFCVHSNSHFN